jgi:Zn-finger nucleic acid-binding protein
MKCPNENMEMQQVKVESHYGQIIILDQCPKCGGIWFDKLELYSVKPGQADKIEKLDLEALNTLAEIENPDLRCPKDNTRLVEFKDPYFPKDIVLIRCTLCDGFWLNRGEFKKYQDYRQKLQHRDEIVIDAPAGKDSYGTPVLYQPPESEDTLGRLARFLSTPVNPYTQLPEGSSQQSAKENENISTILNVLTIILRLVIRR